jgi:hypothetical protein
MSLTDASHAIAWPGPDQASLFAHNGRDLVVCTDPILGREPRCTSHRPAAGSATAGPANGRARCNRHPSPQWLDDGARVEISEPLAGVNEIEAVLLLVPLGPEPVCDPVEELPGLT